MKPFQLDADTETENGSIGFALVEQDGVLYACLVQGSEPTILIPLESARALAAQLTQVADDIERLVMS